MPGGTRDRLNLWVNPLFSFSAALLQVTWLVVTHVRSESLRLITECRHYNAHPMYGTAPVLSQFYFWSSSAFSALCVRYVCIHCSNGNSEQPWLKCTCMMPKADDRQTIKSADFVGRFYRTTKNRPIFVYVTRPILSPDFIARYYRR